MMRFMSQKESLGDQLKIAIDANDVCQLKRVLAQHRNVNFNTVLVGRLEPSHALLYAMGAEGVSLETVKALLYSGKFDLDYKSLNTKSSVLSVNDVIAKLKTALPRMSASEVDEFNALSKLVDTYRPKCRITSNFCC